MTCRCNSDENIATIEAPNVDEKPRLILYGTPIDNTIGIFGRVNKKDNNTNTIEMSTTYAGRPTLYILRGLHQNTFALINVNTFGYFVFTVSRSWSPSTAQKIAQIEGVCYLAIPLFDPTAQTAISFCANAVSGAKQNPYFTPGMETTFATTAATLFGDITASIGQAPCIVALIKALAMPQTWAGIASAYIQGYTYSDGYRCVPDASGIIIIALRFKNGAGDVREVVVRVHMLTLDQMLNPNDQGDESANALTLSAPVLSPMWCGPGCIACRIACRAAQAACIAACASLSGPAAAACVAACCVAGDECYNRC